MHFFLFNNYVKTSELRKIWNNIYCASKATVLNCCLILYWSLQKAEIIDSNVLISTECGFVSIWTLFSVTIPGFGNTIFPHKPAKKKNPSSIQTWFRILQPVEKLCFQNGKQKGIHYVLYVHPINWFKHIIKFCDPKYNWDSFLNDFVSIPAFIQWRPIKQ